MDVGAVLLGVMVERPWRFPMEIAGWDNLHQSVGHSSVLWGRVLSSPATYGQDGGQWTREILSPVSHLSVVLVTPGGSYPRELATPLTFSSILCSPLVMTGGTLGSVSASHSTALNIYPYIHMYTCM